MILCDRHIVDAVRNGNIEIDPPLELSNLESTALNLRVGDDFRIWNEDLGAEGATHLIDLGNINLATIIGLTSPLEPDGNGIVAIPPRKLVLVRTLEYINLRIGGKLAARVEGRSKQARLGMTVHLTAPTIHAGFRGRIVLEIVNHGPFHLQVLPNQSKLCQLILEKVSGVPERGGSATFSDQTTPLGTPSRRRRS